MKNSISRLSTCLVVFGSLVTVSSCRDYAVIDDEATKAIAYEHVFEQIFGEIDPEQNWNMASRASVTVTVDKESEVKVYAIENERKTLVADYSNVVGTRTLGFDVVEGTTDIMVTDGATAQYAKVGDALDFTSSLTRTMYNTDLDIISVSEDYRAFSPAVIKAYTGVVAEEDYTNYQKVSCNFYWVSQGEFTFYPLYWNTASHHILGIYWTDAEGYHEKDVYADKCGDEVQVPDEVNLIWNETTNQNDYSASSWKNAGIQQDLYNHNYVQNCGIKSKAITISLPAGQVFGMYIKVYNTTNTWNETTQMYEFKDGEVAHKVFSEESKNTHMMKEYGGQDWQSVPGIDDKPVHASTFQAAVNGTVYTFFGFEDYYFGPDLNDLIFVFGDNVPTVVDEDAGQEWVLAYEDLGNSFDWDYNDVVLCVGHVSGQTTAKITPWAAGGTLASNIYFGEDDLGEIHQLFGQSEQTSGNYEPVNVEDRGNVGQYKIVTVSENFTMTHLSEYEDGANPNYTIADHGGIVIKVTPEGGSDQLAASIVYDVNNKGTAPEVFCIPRSWEYQDATTAGGVTTKYLRDWRWPKEFAGINTAYPRFAAWAKDRTDNTWYKDHEAPNYYEEYCVTGEFDYTKNSTTEVSDETTYASSSAISIVSKNVELLCNTTYNLSAFFTTASTGDIHYHLESNNANCAFNYGDVIYQLTTGTSDCVGQTCQLVILQESDDTHDQCTGVINITLVESDMASSYDGSAVYGATTLETSSEEMTYNDGAGHTTTYSNATFIDFSDVEASEGATATLYLTFDPAPETAFYLDYADATELYEDFYSDGKTGVAYSLNAEQLQNLLTKTNSESKKGIYIVGFKDAAINVTSAQLVISGGSSGGSTTTEGLTVDTNAPSDVNYGYAYRVDVASGTFDTTKGGTITVTYSAKPNGVFLIDLNNQNAVAGYPSYSSTSYTFTLNAEQIAAYSGGFFAGIWEPAEVTITSIVYTAASE